MIYKDHCFIATKSYSISFCIKALDVETLSKCTMPSFVNNTLLLINQISVKTEKENMLQITILKTIIPIKTFVTCVFLLSFLNFLYVIW